MGSKIKFAVMEEIYYFCCMQGNMIRTYFNNNMAKLKASKLSLFPCSYIGSSDSSTSITDFIELETKGVGIVEMSISKIPFPRTKKSVRNVQTHNGRPASIWEWQNNS